MSMFYELMMRKKEQTMYATIKGALTENNGVFSGFSDSNYLQLQQQFTLSPTTRAEFCFKINVSSIDKLNVFCGSDILRFFYFGVNNSGRIITAFGDGDNWTNLKTSNTILSPNTDYEIKIKIDNNLATVYLNGNIELSFNIGLETTNTFNVRIGKGRSTNDYFNGSIDLPNSYIKLGGKKYNLQAVVGYTIVGSPTIVDGVVSGFSNSNYLKLPSFDFANSNSWKIKFAFELNNNISDWESIFDNSYIKSGLAFYLDNNQQVYFYGGDGTNDTFVKRTNIINANQKYYVQTEFTENSYILSLSTDNINWTIVNTTESNIKLSNTIYDSSYIGYSFRYNGRILTGKIYIKECLIYKDKKLWFNGYPA